MKKLLLIALPVLAVVVGLTTNVAAGSDCCEANESCCSEKSACCATK